MRRIEAIYDAPDDQMTCEYGIFSAHSYDEASKLARMLAKDHNCEVILQVFGVGGEKRGDAEVFNPDSTAWAPTRSADYGSGPDTPILTDYGQGLGPAHADENRDRIEGPEARRDSDREIVKSVFQSMVDDRASNRKLTNALAVSQIVWALITTGGFVYLLLRLSQ